MVDRSATTTQKSLDKARCEAIYARERRQWDKASRKDGQGCQKEAARNRSGDADEFDGRSSASSKSPGHRGGSSLKGRGSPGDVGPGGDENLLRGPSDHKRAAAKGRRHGALLHLKRNAVCDKDPSAIPITYCGWEDCDSDGRVQARLFAGVLKGVLIIRGIPQIPTHFDAHDRRFFGFDSEDDGAGSPHFFQFASDTEVIVSSCFTRLFWFVLDRYQLTSRNHLVWATNVEYDFGNLMKDFYQTPENVDVRWRRGSLTKVELYAGAARGPRAASFKIWDTLNHWKMGVKEIGHKLSDILKYDFGKLEFNPYSLKYAAMDAILSRCYASVQRATYDKKKISLKLTPGATAMEWYMKGEAPDGTKFCPYRLFDTHTDTELDYLMPGLRGGRTEVFSLKPFEGKIGYFDLNSAYPYVMQHRDYPLLSPHRMILDPEQARKYYLSGRMGMCEVEVDATQLSPLAQKIPYLGTIDPKNFRYVFPVGKWRDKYTCFEIDQAEKLGYKFKILSGIFYDRAAKQPFEKFIHTAYELRLEGTRNNDPVLKDIGKSLMNNLFGKFGQRLVFAEYQDTAQLSATEQKASTQLGSGSILEIDHGYAKQTNVIWSAYVTAYTRDLLYDKMMAALAAGNEVIYCDTDSIFITGGEWPETHPTELGALKWEDDLKYFQAWLPKTYAYESLTSNKGVQYRAKGVPFAQRELFITTGLVEYRKPVKLREALRRKNYSRDTPEFQKRIGTGLRAVNAWVTVQKELKGAYTKRLAHKDGSTYPLTLDSVKEIPLDLVEQSHEDE